MKWIASWIASAAVFALTPLGVSAQTSGAPFDRVAFSADGSTLTGTNGGGGGSIAWLHNFDADKLVVVAAEHQVLSVSHWSFGSLTGSLSVGSGDRRYTFYGEAHEGAGDDGGKAFKYRVEALGVSGTYFHRLSATLEDKQLNVETTHGNLPKFELSYLWSARVQTTLSYQHSFGGNLGTQLTSGRIDLYGPVNFLGGFAVGRASPTVLGFLVTLPPARFAGGLCRCVEGLLTRRPRLHRRLPAPLGRPDDHQRRVRQRAAYDALDGDLELHVASEREVT